PRFARILRRSAQRHRPRAARPSRGADERGPPPPTVGATYESCEIYSRRPQFHDRYPGGHGNAATAARPTPRTSGDHFRYAADRTVKSRARALLGAACSIHFLHDGFSETLYVFLPLWAREFGLSLAQVGLIRSAYTGGMSAFQLPAGFLAERWG